MDANVAIGIGLAFGFTGLGVGIGQGIAVNGALNGMARQPELSKFLSTQMLIGLVFPELAVLFAFVVALILNGKVSTPTAGATGMLEREQLSSPAPTQNHAVALNDGRKVAFN